MFTYIIIFFILLAVMLVYFKIAERYEIIDKPNSRSSHTKITLRGGGIVFPIAAIIWYVGFGFQQPWIILATAVVAVVSIIDDIKPLSSKVRISAHFFAATLLFWQIGLFASHWYIILAAYILTTGWINAFNFMDGINGISGFYGLVTLISLFWLNTSIGYISSDLIVVLILSALIFLFYNARKQAKTFAGDVGSVSLAFLLAWMLLLLILKTGKVQFVLLVMVYGIDSVVTIIVRLWRRENIFEAHRSHLYQYLCNELKLPHVFVASIYGFVQLCVNIFTIVLASNQNLTWPIFAVSVFTILVIYLLARFLTLKEINREEYLNYAKNKG